jgi:hypothetical protein
MAEALGLASSIIAVVDISVKILSVCSKYYKEVRGADKNIRSLEDRLNHIGSTLSKLGALVETKDSVIKDPYALKVSLAGCQSLLEEVQGKLDEKVNERTRSWRCRLKLRSLQWPFKASEVKSIIVKIDSYQSAFNLDLAVEHT